MRLLAMLCVVVSSGCSLEFDQFLGGIDGAVGGDSGADAASADAATMDAGVADAARDDGAVGRDAGLDADGATADAGIYQLTEPVVLGTLRGFGGGMADIETACPAGIIVELEGQNNIPLGFPENVFVRCSELATDGALGPPVAVDRLAGTCESVMSVWSQTCPPGEVGIGLRGRVTDAGGGVDIMGHLGLVCAPLVDWLRDGSGINRLPLAGTDSRMPIEDFEDLCPPGSVLTDLRGRQGCAIDAIQIGCRNVRR